MLVLNATTEVKTITTLSPNITKAQVLALLHDEEKMVRMNPIIKSHERLPESSAIAFFKSVPAEHRPPATGTSQPSVFHIIEESGGEPEDGAQAGNWRGGWAKRFVPDTLAYETSIQATENGMISITRAPMGVHSVTIWTVVEKGAGEPLVVEKTGRVTSNRMLMTFIKTTLQESYETLARDFEAALEKEVNEDQVLEKVT